MHFEANEKLDEKSKQKEKKRCSAKLVLHIATSPTVNWDDDSNDDDDHPHPHSHPRVCHGGVAEEQDQFYFSVSSTRSPAVLSGSIAVLFCAYVVELFKQLRPAQPHDVHPWAFESPLKSCWQ